ncbi:kinesin-like protein subito [Sitodiplosis mosellana]|uniref:kinesin-like protein subito n=1 Tax=Sitodiplosis mosellana TaxID=263140 RepID=UPI002443C838|nr:kinesin-like protein subito [Sitodiplosis mosellana]
MSNDRVSYMYQRDPSIDRRYRPKPRKIRDLFKEITEEEDTENVAPNGSNSMSSACSQNSSDTIDTTASVFLRLRPIKKACKHYEAENNLLKVLPIEMATSNNKDMAEKHFEFSKIFHNNATQLDIYNQSVHVSIQNEENLTILTYGTSGSGKTYTMYGTESDAGIVQRAIAHIFSMDQQIICPTPAAKIDKGNFLLVSEENIKDELNFKSQFVKNENALKNKQMLKQICDEHEFQLVENPVWQFVFVWISFAEIYNENVYDLLKPNAGGTVTKRKNLKIISNDGNSYIKDLASVHVASATEAFDVIQAGLQQVNYASTNINANSSRSHCILIVNVIHFSYPDRYSTSTYKFCDLAGSERLKKTENVGDRLKEAQRINTSLMVLGRCFDLMFHNQQSKGSKEVVPFRESKLTMLLQKSLMGHEKITTIVTMAPKIDFMEENLHVLNFASIAQQIVYKQPKQESRDRRTARSTRFSWFMNSIGQRNDSDWNDLFEENQRLENENMDLRYENEQLVEQLDGLKAVLMEAKKEEQELRNQLVEEREQMVNNANKKAAKRLAYEQSKAQKVIDELKQELNLLRQKQATQSDEDESDDDDKEEVEIDSSLDEQEPADSTIPFEDLEHHGADGESFEKKRRLSSPYK